MEMTLLSDIYPNIIVQTFVGMIWSPCILLIFILSWFLDYIGVILE